MSIGRRAFLGVLGGAAVARPAPIWGQAPARLGYLSGGRRDTNLANTIDILRAALRDRGWRPGENLVIDERWASGDSSRLPRLARELVEQRPDVLSCTGTTETRALQAVTSTIPIVFLQVAVDPVSAGFVQHIARPGRNITGFMQSPQILWGKRIELLTEILGRQPRRLAWLGNPGNTGAAENWADAQAAAARVKSEVIRVEARSAADLEPAFQIIKGRDALLVQFDFLFAMERHRLADLAAKHRIPAIYSYRQVIKEGGLMSYGPETSDIFQRSASYVDRILKGANPAELPAQAPAKFEFAINLKTAMALGLTAPSTVVALADEVIE